MAELFTRIPSPIALLVGIALLILGGNWLVDGSVRIAQRLGVSTLLVGLTIVAFGTSAPELAFNLAAALNGNSELSFGNVVGSNIANIALVLGFAAIIGPLVVHSRVVQRELPLLLIVSGGMLLLAWLPATRPIADPGLRYAYTRNDGFIAVGCFALFMWYWYRTAKRERMDPLMQEIGAEAAAVQGGSLALAVLLFLLGLGALVAGGQLTQSGAVGVAEWFGLSQALIGLTIVAVATSLPEVVTSLVACRKGHNDLAVGNVVGSNLFNILLVLGVTAVIAPVPVPGARGWWDLAVMMLLTVLLLPIAHAHRGRILRWEGAVLLLCYAAYIGFRVMHESLG